VFEAWGDESGSVESADPGVYLMGAVLARPEAANRLREAMNAVRRPPERKVHWHGASPTRRDQLIDVVAGLTLEAVIVVRQGDTGERFERRRRKCFETFVPTLAEMGCTHLTLESRGAHDDALDQTMLRALRSGRRLDSTLRLDHTPGPLDAALWVADVVCGAVVADRIGHPKWLARIAEHTQVILIDNRHG
jgi:hypothetical protein